uniref:Transmembrane protein n=1 Tax=Chromera velia CCMP2878 TaxID=1169474 RepID=A0A0G4I4M4_9ALVE|eukprot:Cvel_10910.t1-p1 / transcript=Cvel_10910.t1 / gene=Cvel_10910 / organism=Chromera_velia_CCMP2878 / gene_product=hypothetical protein / transcript_product=hypothetical protein / location=Cvel_scaffold670:4741-20059(+) / protein_length=825 / sequence_SO=supercontig / SO=protein_coding / is_pseudo=false
MGNSDVGEHCISGRELREKIGAFLSLFDQTGCGRQPKLPKRRLSCHVAVTEALKEGAKGVLHLFMPPPDPPPCPAELGPVPVRKKERRRSSAEVEVQNSSPSAESKPQLRGAFGERTRRRSSGGERISPSRREVKGEHDVMGSPFSHGKREEQSQSAGPKKSSKVPDSPPRSSRPPSSSRRRRSSEGSATFSPPQSKERQRRRSSGEISAKEGYSQEQNEEQQPDRGKKKGGKSRLEMPRRSLSLDQPRRKGGGREKEKENANEDPQRLPPIFPPSSNRKEKDKGERERGSGGSVSFMKGIHELPPPPGVVPKKERDREAERDEGGGSRRKEREREKETGGSRLNRRVSVSVDLLRVGSVDTIEELLVATFEVHLWWPCTSAEHEKVREARRECFGQALTLPSPGVSDVWRPGPLIRFGNLLHLSREDRVLEDGTEPLRSSKILRETWTVTGTFKFPMNLSRFPYDRQIFALDILAQKEGAVGVDGDPTFTLQDDRARPSCIRFDVRKEHPGWILAHAPTVWGDEDATTYDEQRETASVCLFGRSTEELETLRLHDGPKSFAPGPQGKPRLARGGFRLGEEQAPTRRELKLIDLVGLSMHHKKALGGRVLALAYMRRREGTSGVFLSLLFLVVAALLVAALVSGPRHLPFRALLCGAFVLGLWTQRWAAGRALPLRDYKTLADSAYNTSGILVGLVLLWTFVLSLVWRVSDEIVRWRLEEETLAEPDENANMNTSSMARPSMSLSERTKEEEERDDILEAGIPRDWGRALFYADFGVVGLLLLVSLGMLWRQRAQRTKFLTEGQWPTVAGVKGYGREGNEWTIGY